jgi:hypothetical protein
MRPGLSAGSFGNRVIVMMMMMMMMMMMNVDSHCA